MDGEMSHPEAHPFVNRRPCLTVLQKQVYHVDHQRRFSVIGEYDAAEGQGIADGEEAPFVAALLDHPLGMLVPDAVRGVLLAHAQGSQSAPVLPSGIRVTVVEAPRSRSICFLLTPAPQVVWDGNTELTMRAILHLMVTHPVAPGSAVLAACQSALASGLDQMFAQADYARFAVSLLYVTDADNGNIKPVQPPHRFWRTANADGRLRWEQPPCPPSLVSHTFDHALLEYCEAHDM